MRLFFSTLGTSLLTNFIKHDPLFRSQINLNACANAKKDEYTEQQRESLEQMADELCIHAENWSNEEASQASAELNALISFGIPQPTDLFFFLVSDTFQSRKAFEILHSYFQHKHNIQIQAVEIRGLNTLNRESFMTGIKELMYWTDCHLPDYKKQGYEILFNLTGGFKSLMGFLLPIGMFHADRIFYIFQGAELIEIPKLPIVMDDALFNKYASSFLLLADDHFLDKEQIKGIPMALLESVDNNYFGLSAWGLFSWNRIKTKVLTEKLIQLPFMEYQTSFMTDFENKNTKEDRLRLQERLAHVSSLLIESKGDSSILKKDNGLRYENCRIKKFDGQIVGHFRYSGKLRVSCVSLNGKLLMLHNGSHDVCN